MKKSRSLFVLIGIACLVAAGVFVWECRGDAHPVTQRADDKSKFLAELAEIRRAEEALATAERLTAWELDFRGEVLTVAPGRECFYYLLHLPNSFPDAPGRQGALPAVTANFERSDARHAVVCVDLKTGRIRWSREVNGLVCLAVAPDSDVLYLYRERILSLAPDSGAVVEQTDLPGRGRNIQGLMVKGELVLHQPHARNRIAPDAHLSVYDIATKTNKLVNVADHRLLSPDESRRLVRNGPAWDCVQIPSGQRMWSVPELDDERWPLWRGGDALFVRGNERQLGTITAVDFATGTPRWAAVLGWGVYESWQHQLRGGGYPDHLMPYAAIENHLLAFDGSGRLYFLDPANGRREASPQLDRNYLAMPFQFGGELIVCSFEGLRAYSLSSLVQPASSAHSRLQIRKAVTLLALGRGQEALEAMDWLVDRAPELQDAWMERARLCEALGDSEEEAFSRCRALAMSSNTQDETLRRRWGLMRLYSFEGKPAWPLAYADGHVYAGTLAGGLWSVHANSLDVGLVARLDHEIAALTAKPELQAVLGNSTHTRRAVPQNTAQVDEGIPMERYSEGGAPHIGGPIQYRGRQFWPMRGGVRVLAGTNMQDVISPLTDLGEWAIHLSPFGPLGYGSGVSELDDNLCPVRWLVRPAVADESGVRATVAFMASTAQSLGIVLSSAKGMVLQTYTRAGALLNEVSLGLVSSWARTEQLVPLGNGYLLSDRQLVWAGATAERGQWRFGPSLKRTSTERFGEQWRYFGDPLILHGCLYVTGLDGQLYVFDTSHITGSAN